MRPIGSTGDTAPQISPFSFPFRCRPRGGKENVVSKHRVPIFTEGKCFGTSRINEWYCFFYFLFHYSVVKSIVCINVSIWRYICSLLVTPPRLPVTVIHFKQPEQHIKHDLASPIYTVPWAMYNAFLYSVKTQILGTCPTKYSTPNQTKKKSNEK